MKFTFTFLFITLLSLTLCGQAYWKDKTEANFQKNGTRYIVPQKYRTITLDSTLLKQDLATAPLEKSGQGQPLSLAIPMPDGKTAYFLIEEAPIMEAGLAAQFPLIKTYVGRGVNDVHASIRLGWTHKGFHATIYSPNGTVYIDPYDHHNKTEYISYYKKDYQSNKSFHCDVQGYAGDEFDIEDPILSPTGIQKNIGAQLRTYRLALACTGEYSQFHGSTVNSVMSAMVTTMNRVNGVYERELSIRFILVNNNNNLIFLNAGSDPYVNTSAGQMINQNGNTINSIIGNGSYDIGHVFSTGGGGLAGLGVVCSNNSKARGVTGQSQPVGDPFDIDYVAHEMGHQFGGNHTFNGSSGSCSGNIAGTHSYEPGSGTTIMAYAGICAPQNTANNSDDYFHTHSFDEMVAYSNNGNGNTCAVITNTGNNEPNVDAGAGGFFIPISTPFELTGSATDPNGDPLTYCWEQFDLGPQGAPNAPSGNAPLFRSFDPVPTPTRVFPRIQDIISNTQTLGEILPSYSRQLNFRLTARDNVPGNGGVSYDGMGFNVTNSAGPFLVTEPNVPSITWIEGSLGNVTWDVANTDQAPVNATNVDIFLSTDGGLTYPTTLATNVMNDGTETVFVPIGSASTQARVKVKAANNVFFDISNANFTIEAPTVPDYVIFEIDSEQTICAPNTATYSFTSLGLVNFNDPITLSAANVPTGATINYSANPVQPGDTVQITITDTENAATGTYPITITATSTTADKNIELNLVLFSTSPTEVVLESPMNGAVDVAIRPQLTWVENAPHTYEIEIATDLDFNNIIESATNLTTNLYTATQLDAYTIYYWRVKADNQCSDPGDFSAPYAFRTATATCTTYAGGLQRAIFPNFPLTYVSNLNVPDDFAIIDINVLDITGTHTQISDLSFRIESPAGTEVQLMPQNCGSQNNFFISFDDDAASANLPCPPTDGNAYQPLGTLADFNTESSQGSWRLRVQDHVAGNGGELQTWSLEVCYAVPNSNAEPVIVNNDTLIMTIGTLDTIKPTLLLVEDADNVAADLEFKLLTIPTKGDLSLNGITLTIGSTFTQADIDTALLLYQHNGVAEMDQFTFEVIDGVGGWLQNQTYLIAPIVPVVPPVPPLPNGTTALFPNPTYQDLNVLISTDNDEQIIITVYDMTGRLVLQPMTEQSAGQIQNTYTLPMQELASGMYVVKIQGQSFEVIEKVMVVHN